MRSPLYCCVEEGGLIVANLLLSRGADIDLKDKDGFSPLKLVIQKSNMTILQLFLNHHQLVSTPQRHDFSQAVLFEAVECGGSDTVRYLVESKYVSVATTNVEGETPLHLAIKLRNSSMMRLLDDLDPYGKMLIVLTRELETPAHYAARYGSAQEVELLLQYLTRTFGDLHTLEAANPLNAVQQQGMTSLFIAGIASDMTARAARNHDTETSHANSDARNIEARLLLRHGARLFPPGFLEQKLASASYSAISFLDENSHVTLPAELQRCLRSWIAEDGARVDEPGDEEDTLATRDNVVVVVSELWMSWAVSVAHPGPLASVLPILVYAGYSRDLAPLLVELPLKRKAIPALLRQLDKFARHERCSPLLRQLYDKLVEVYELRSSWFEF
ncbi:unnamed protein product [Phytophthora fragariaefolia]|uniref:Unnamed protein product n=1 Tax=Phytophthora fragariaefolia TaxID=1490495 RepID=A0A9W7CRN9_9STRA|nr:unnamed protein product [Phytophthora fragariaefolia]